MAGQADHGIWMMLWKGEKVSDSSQGPGWWLASDGKWYPPEAAQQSFSSPPTGPDTGRPKRRNWMMIGLIGGGVLLVLMLIGAIASPSDEDGETTDAGLDPDEQAIEDGYVALCNDGNYSNNTDFSATCSGGDGIDKWLATFGECEDGTFIKMSSDASCGDNGGFKGLLPADFEPKARKNDVALCKDGTFSDNTDFSATCSSRGGIREWLALYGECKDGTIIIMDKESSCSGSGGFKGLKPKGYEPPTTTTTAPPTTAAPPPSTAPPATEAPAPAESVSQQNARQKAADYLDFSAFSRQGLIEQLEFEGFSNADATYGVDALSVDWNEQAAKKAADYLEFSSFSRNGLIEQLVFEGFTQAQAEYGVSTTGL